MICSRDVISTREQRARIRTTHTLTTYNKGGPVYAKADGVSKTPHIETSHLE